MAKAKKQDKPIWLKYTEEEVKEIVLKLAGKGLTTEKIGLTLRDTYGIPRVKLYNLKLNKILKEKDLYQSPDLKNLKAKVEKVEKHLEKNKQDQRSKRARIISKAKEKKQKEYQEKEKKK